MAVALLAAVVGAAASGSASAWAVAAAVAVVGASYLLAVVRVRRLSARREMSAAFATNGRLDWDDFEGGLAAVALSPEVGAGEVARPAVSGFDRELAAFLGAWVLGLVLTPVVAVLRLAGHDLSDPDRRGLLGTLVRLQAYGRSQSLKVVAAGLFATAGVTAVGAAASGGTAYALPAHTTSIGPHTVGEYGAGPAVAGWTSRWSPGTDRPSATKPHQKKPHHAKSTRAAKALSVALAQVGKPYQYGAAGPNVFDCSGLVMYSWAAAGVSLPHNSGEQYDITTHISESQLRPGDLVFYYGYPPGHVAMYIGNGRVVSANTTGTNVQTQSITWDGTPMGFTRVS